MVTVDALPSQPIVWSLGVVRELNISGQFTVSIPLRMASSPLVTAFLPRLLLCRFVSSRRLLPTLAPVVILAQVPPESVSPRYAALSSSPSPGSGCTPSGRSARSSEETAAGHVVKRTA